MSTRGPLNGVLRQATQYTKLNRLEVYEEINPARSELSQKGKVIVVTGASQGVGREGILWAFAQTKPKAIVLVARDAERLNAAAKEIKAVDSDIEALVVPTDIAHEVLWTVCSRRLQKNSGTPTSSSTTLAYRAIRLSSVMRIQRHGGMRSQLHVNGYGTFLVSRAFLRLLGPTQPGTVITVASHSSFIDLPGESSYTLSKLLTFNIAHYIAIENPNVTSISMHPGVISTAILKSGSVFEPYAGDSITLAGATVAWLASEEAKWLNGRYVLSVWDMAELVARKEAILEKNELVLGLRAQLGAEYHV